MLEPLLLTWNPTSLAEAITVGDIGVDVDP
jgi:hypothetical protein